MRNQREEANVSDGPPVEHSIMKRAWPYALALAVVVTGCYLALAPLLRSLNPGPTATASATLVGSSTTTVSESKVIPLSGVAPRHGFTALVQTKKKAKKTTTHGKPAHTSTAATTAHFVAPSTPTTSGTSSSSGSTSTTTTTVKTATKTPSTKKPAANSQRPAIGGTIDQSDNGGFAGQGNGDSTMAGGKTSTLAGN
jgi:hypothetical protein